MFTKSTVAKGHTYYQVVQGTREGPRVRQRLVVALGPEGNTVKALETLRSELRRVRGERKRFPDTPKSKIASRAAPTDFIGARPGFFIFDAKLCHARYGMVSLAVEPDEVASFVRRVLGHPSCDTQAKRLGRVMRISQLGIRVFQLAGQEETMACEV
jgi:hypothetical protein